MYKEEKPSQMQTNPKMKRNQEKLKASSLNPQNGQTGPTPEKGSIPTNSPMRPSFKATAQVPQTNPADCSKLMKTRMSKSSGITPVEISSGRLPQLSYSLKE